MLKRTIEISQTPAYVCLRNRQLQFELEDGSQSQVACEDTGFLIVDHPRVKYSHSALVAIAEHGGVTVLCGAGHLPDAVILPVSGHSLIAERQRRQWQMSQPLQKRIWQQIVRAKILGQVSMLSNASAAAKRMRNLAGTVKSGDSSNNEAHAAKLYWADWLLGSELDPALTAEFRRIPGGGGINALLDYGYSILRAAVARAIVAAGMTPVCGVYHRNRSNSFCLADDLVEPLRPIVDDRVRTLVCDGVRDIDSKAKQAILGLLTLELTVADRSGPLMVALSRYIQSFIDVMEEKGGRLEIPVPCN